MITVEFLREMLPSEGFICLCYPISGATSVGGSVPMVNAPFDDFSKAAAEAVKRAQTVDVYYALFTYPETFEKTNGNGNSYPRIRRTQVNAGLTRLLWADLDVGDSTDTEPKYATQRDAIVAICAFCDEIGLPWPMLVDSGYGVHCYWRFTRPLTRAEWQPIADLFEKVLVFKGVLHDSKVTRDAARVLRVVGTFNHKRKSTLKRVKCRELSAPVEPELVIRVLQAVAADMPIEEVVEVAHLPPAERPTVKALRTECPTFTRMAAEAPSASEGVWWTTLQLVRHTTGGEALGHALSALHPDYVRETTQGKLDRMTELDLGPPTCGTMEKLYGAASPCLTCPHYGLFKSSPIVFARRKPETELPEEVPPPLRPFLRTKRGIEYQPAPTVDMPVPPAAVVIYEYDFYPTRIMDDAIRKDKLIEWVAHLPIKGPTKITLAIDAYTQTDKMISTLAKQGVTIDSHHAKRMGTYVSHYIKQLQAMKAEDALHDHMGYVEGTDNTVFLWGNKLITATGMTDTHVAASARNAAQGMKQKGTLAGQIAAQEFYNHDEYLPQQFYAMCGLGAPLFYLTRHHGAWVNLTGPSGASKSSCAALTGGYYGDPVRFVLNGTAAGFTVKARLTRLETLSCLPLILDEITNMPPETLKELALSVSQGGHRGRLDGAGVEIPVPDSVKASLMLTTSNNSVHSILALNNASGSAGSMRTNEPTVGYTKVHTKAQADEFLIQVQDNYGWIGPLFVQECIKNSVKVQKSLAQITKELDERANIQPSERYWSATFVIAVLACSIASAKGWVPFDPDKLMDWCVNVQLPRLRGVVADAYMTPVGVLAAFLAESADKILVVQSQQNFREMLVLNEARRGELVGRYEPEHDRAYVTSNAFRRYCDRMKLSYDSTIRYLVDHRIVAHDRIDLGRGVPSIASTTGRVLRIDMAHEELSGLPPVETTSGAQIIQFSAPVQKTGRA